MQAGGIESSESIPGLLKLLQIRALFTQPHHARDLNGQAQEFNILAPRDACRMRRLPSRAIWNIMEHIRRMREGPRGQILGRNPDKSLKSFLPFLFIVTSTALPWDFSFFKLTQPLPVSTVQLLYTVKEKGGKTDRKPYPLPLGLRNPYRNLTSENSQDYAQKPQRNCTFMNSASGQAQKKTFQGLLFGFHVTLCRD
jgi:hypothetical protein